MLKQFVITVSAGKRLIAKATAKHPAVQAVLKKGMLVVVAGSTNGYVAEEILGDLGQVETFTRIGFRRGLTVAPGASVPKVELAGDVVIVDGKWQPGKTIFDVADELKTGDVVIKGGNALDMAADMAGVQIGHPECGTAGAALPHVVGKRVRLIVPIGLEKRVPYSIDAIAGELNDPESTGPRLLPLPGEVLSELDAVAMLTGAEAMLTAAGGAYGAEGGVWLSVRGSEEELTAAEALIKSVADEPPCEI